MEAPPGGPRRWRTRGPEAAQPQPRLQKALEDDGADTPPGKPAAPTSELQVTGAPGLWKVWGAGGPGGLAQPRESHSVGEREAAWSSEGLPSQWSARDTGVRAAPTRQTPAGGAGFLPAENAL